METSKDFYDLLCEKTIIYRNNNWVLFDVLTKNAYLKVCEGTTWNEHMDWFEQETSPTWLEEPFLFLNIKNKKQKYLIQKDIFEGLKIYDKDGIELSIAGILNLGMPQTLNRLICKWAKYK